MDAIGIHAIFGGFILGTVMPRGLFVQEVKKKIEPLAVVLLLPMFFTYSGLNTRMDMVNSWSLLVLMAIVTTMMAGPLFEWVYGRQARANGELAQLAT